MNFSSELKNNEKSVLGFSDHGLMFARIKEGKWRIYILLVRYMKF